MKNKVLILLNVPSLANQYDLYIPVNERMDKIIHLLLMGLKDLTEYNFLVDSKNYVLINSVTGKVYGNNDIVRDTDIRNGSKVILISNQ